MNTRFIVLVSLLACGADRRAGVVTQTPRISPSDPAESPSQSSESQSPRVEDETLASPRPTIEEAVGVDRTLAQAQFGHGSVRLALALYEGSGGIRERFRSQDEYQDWLDPIQEAAYECDNDACINALAGDDAWLRALLRDEFESLPNDLCLALLVRGQGWAPVRRWVLDASTDMIEALRESHVGIGIEMRDVDGDDVDEAIVNYGFVQEMPDANRNRGYTLILGMPNAVVRAHWLRYFDYDPGSNQGIKVAQVPVFERTRMRLRLIVGSGNDCPWARGLPEQGVNEDWCTVDETAVTCSGTTTWTCPHPNDSRLRQTEPILREPAWGTR